MREYKIKPKMVLDFLSNHPSIFIIAITYMIMGIVLLYWKKTPKDDEDFDNLPDGEVIVNPSFVGNTDTNDNRYVSTVHSYDFRRNNEISNASSSSGRYTARNPDEVDYANADFMKQNKNQKNNKIKEEVEYANVGGVSLRKGDRNSKVQRTGGPLDFKENGLNVQYSSGAYLHMDDFDDFDVLSRNSKDNVMRITLNFNGEPSTSYLNRT